MDLFSVSTLFKVAAGLNAISIPGHTKYGFDHVYPAINAIPSTGQHLVGKRGAQVAWNYINWSLAVAALLNWQWSQTRGPQSTYEKMIFWTLFLGGATSGFRYWQINSYKPLLCLWAAPFFSAAGWMLASS